MCPINGGDLKGGIRKKGGYRKFYPYIFLISYISHTRILHFSKILAYGGPYSSYLMQLTERSLLNDH